MLKLVVLASLLAITSSTSVEAADRWVMVSSDTRGALWLVDNQTVSASQAWVLVVSPYLNYNEGGKFFYNYRYGKMAFDCQDRRSRSLALELKDANGKSLWIDDQFNGEWSDVKPDTVVEGALDYVCGKRKPDSPTFSSPETALRIVVSLEEDAAR